MTAHEWIPIGQIAQEFGVSQSTLRNRTDRYQRAGLAERRSQSGTKATWHVRRDAVEAFAAGERPPQGSAETSGTSDLLAVVVELQQQLAEARANEDRLRSDLIAASDRIAEADRKIADLVQVNRTLLNGYDRASNPIG
nr:GntR family transcriptional regulator [Euzebya pacifica]